MVVDGPRVFDVIVNMRELGGVVLVSLQDLRQVEESVLLRYITGGGVVVVPDGEGVPGPGAVQQGAGQSLQAVGGAEVKESREVSNLSTPRSNISVDGEGEEGEAVLGDVGHQVLGQRLVQLVLAVRGDGEGLTQELQGVAGRPQQPVQLLNLGLAFHLAESLRLPVHLQVETDQAGLGEQADGERDEESERVLQLDVLQTHPLTVGSLQDNPDRGPGAQRFVQHHHHLVLALRDLPGKQREGETLGGDGGGPVVCPLEDLGGEVEDSLDKLEVVVPGLEVHPLGEGDEAGPVLGRDLLLPDPEQEGDHPVLLEDAAHQLGGVPVHPLQEHRAHYDQLQPSIEQVGLHPGGQMAAEVLHGQVLHLEPRLVP